MSVGTRVFAVINFGIIYGSYDDDETDVYYKWRVCTINDLKKTDTSQLACVTNFYVFFRKNR